MMEEIILPQKLSKPRGCYSHGVFVKPGHLLFIAGQIGVDSEENVVGIGDVYTQTKRVYENKMSFITSIVFQINLLSRSHLKRKVSQFRF